MRRRSGMLLCIFLLPAVFTACKPLDEMPPLRRDAMAVSKGIQDRWSKVDMGSVFFINAEEKNHLPPALTGLTVAPSTTFDYLYVRVWEKREQKQTIRRYLAHFIIRDLESGEMLRGSIENGISNFQPLPKEYWKMLS